MLNLNHAKFSFYLKYCVRLFAESDMKTTVTKNVSLP